MRSTPAFRRQARLALDQRVAGLGDLIGSPPPRGWIRALRTARGLSAFELGARMGVSRQRVLQLEHAETTGSLTLATLERAASALGCRLHYVLVPHAPLVEDAPLLEDAPAPGRPREDGA